MIGNMEVQGTDNFSSISSGIELPFSIKCSRRFILISSNETSDASIEVTAHRRSKCR